MMGHMMMMTHPRTLSKVMPLDDHDDDGGQQEQEPGCQRWLDLDGPAAGEIDLACQFALVLAHEQGFYTSTALLMDRLLHREAEHMSCLQDWMRALCRARPIEHIILLARSSGRGKSTCHRQLALRPSLPFSGLRRACRTSWLLSPPFPRQWHHRWHFAPNSCLTALRGSPSQPGPSRATC